MSGPSGQPGLVAPVGSPIAKNPNIVNPATGLIYPALVPVVPATAVVVSPIGTTTPGVTQPNNGAPFGPDTAGTTTGGIQEAFNSLPSVTFYDGGNNLVGGKSGWVHLLGMCSVTSLVTIPPGDIRFTSIGPSTWLPFLTISGPYAAIGGGGVIGSAACASTGVVACPLDAHGVPGTRLSMQDMEIRVVSPAGPTGPVPPPLDLRGHQWGEVSNVQVLEVAAAGGLGTNIQAFMINANCGPDKTKTIYRNMVGYGGSVGGVTFGQAHCFAYNIGGGGSSGAFACGVQIGQNIDNWFGNLHLYDTAYGLIWGPYGAGDPPYQPMVIHGVHFESCSHYVIGEANGVTGTLIIEQPVWDVGQPTPSSDIAASLALGSNTYSMFGAGVNTNVPSGIAVITRDEIDTPNYGAGRHVTVPKASWTAGTSPYTPAPQPFNALWVITTVGGMTALTLDGQALFNGSPAAGQQVFVGAGHSLGITWATTAPVFEVLPL